MNLKKLLVLFSFCCLLKGVTSSSSSSSCLPNPIPTSCPTEKCTHWTELEFAIFFNCSEEVEQQLDQLEAWNPRSGVNYKLALEVAAGAGHTKIVSAILQRREKLGIELHGCEMASWLAAENDHREVLELLLEAGSGIEDCTGGRRRPREQRAPSLLFAAAKGGSVESLTLLIDSGANLDAWDCRGSDIWGWFATVLEESMRRYLSPRQVKTYYEFSFAFFQIYLYMLSMFTLMIICRCR